MSNTVYVVTGANRGIGLGLAKALLARPNTTVIATARQPAVAGLETELAGSHAESSTYRVVHLDSGHLPSTEELRALFPKIDVLIANAGMASSLCPSLSTTAEDLQEHFAVNTIAPLMLFQALWPLMKEAKQPKFIPISSSVGGITVSELPGGAYGPSKAALNWITRRLHMECEELVSVAVHPGWVQTANGDAAAKAWGFGISPPLTVDESVKGILSVIDEASRETTSGKFVSYDGQILQW